MYYIYDASLATVILKIRCGIAYLYVLPVIGSLSHIGEVCVGEGSGYNTPGEAVDGVVG